MRFSIASIALFAAGALAIDVSGAPACAQTCLSQNAGSSACDPNATSPSCFCADSKFFNLVQSCVLTSCTTSDIVDTLTWYNNLC